MSLTETKTKPSATQPAPLRRVEVRDILKRHPGSISMLADELGVTVTSVSMCLRGKGTSQRIADACEAKAREFLKQEAA